MGRLTEDGPYPKSVENSAGVEAPSLGHGYGCPGYCLGVVGPPVLGIAPISPLVAPATSFYTSSAPWTVFTGTENGHVFETAQKARQFINFRGWGRSRNHKKNRGYNKVPNIKRKTGFSSKISRGQKGAFAGFRFENLAQARFSKCRESAFYHVISGKMSLLRAKKDFLACFGGVTR